jgi:hypothetical protein
MVYMSKWTIIIMYWFKPCLRNDWSRWFAISGLPPIWCSQWGAMAACQ